MAPKKDNMGVRLPISKIILGERCISSRSLAQKPVAWGSIASSIFFPLTAYPLLHDYCNVYKRSVQDQKT